MYRIQSPTTSKKVVKINQIKEAQDRSDRTVCFSAPNDKKKSKAQSNSNNNQEKANTRG